MDITIHFCKTCGFREHAEDIAEALNSELGLTSEFVEGFWGTFRIYHGDEEVYNRWRTHGIWGRIGLGHTPTPDEIVSLFRDRVAMQTGDQSLANA